MTVQYACPVCGETGEANVEEVLSDHGLVVTLISSKCPGGCAPSVDEVKVALGICPTCGRRLSHVDGRPHCPEHGFIELG